MDGPVDRADSDNERPQGPRGLRQSAKPEPVGWYPCMNVPGPEWPSGPTGNQAGWTGVLRHGASGGGMIRPGRKTRPADSAPSPSPDCPRASLAIRKWQRRYAGPNSRRGTTMMSVGWVLVLRHPFGGRRASMRPRVARREATRPVRDPPAPSPKRNGAGGAARSALGVRRGGGGVRSARGRSQGLAVRPSERYRPVRTGRPARWRWCAIRPGRVTGSGRGPSERRRPVRTGRPARWRWW